MLKEIAAEQAASVVKEQLKKNKVKKVIKPGPVQTTLGKWKYYNIVSSMFFLKNKLSIPINLFELSKGLLANLHSLEEIFFNLLPLSFWKLTVSQFYSCLQLIIVAYGDNIPSSQQIMIIITILIYQCYLCCSFHSPRMLLFRIYTWSERLSISDSQWAILLYVLLSFQLGLL